MRWGYKKYKFELKKDKVKKTHSLTDKCKNWLKNKYSTKNLPASYT